MKNAAVVKLDITPVYGTGSCGGSSPLSGTRKQLSIKHKNSISKALKKAHAEGRHPGWPSVSYAEKYFKEVFINEGYKFKEDFFTQFQIGRFKTDFCFIKKMLVIEIDGRHHDSKENIEFDRKRDKKIKGYHFKILRIKWRLFSRNKKEYLKKILMFIENVDEDKINNFIDCQNKEIENRRKEREEKRKQGQYASEKLKMERTKDIENIDFKRGDIKKLSIKWGVSHTQVRRYIREVIKI